MPPARRARAGTPPAAQIEFPFVVLGDDGIRPYGLPDTCFFCRQRIENRHARTCGRIVKRVALAVTVELVDGWIALGSWALAVPHAWTPQRIERILNRSAWCASNFLKTDRVDVTWDAVLTPGAQGAQTHAPTAVDIWGLLDAREAARAEGETWGVHEGLDGAPVVPCLCAFFHAAYVETVDATPRRAAEPCVLSPRGSLP